MSYGIIRVQKFGTGSVKGIEIHDRRGKEHSHTNKEIDFGKSHQNYALQEKDGTFLQAIKQRIELLHLKKAVRKDAVVMAQVLVTSDREFFDQRTPEQTKEFFKQSYDFLKKRYGAENVISSTVHMDERTPHMHFNFVPVTNDGRLSAKAILTRENLIRQQDEFYQQVGKEWGLLRGEKGGYKTHLETAEFKKQTTYKEVGAVELQLANLQEERKALERQVQTLKARQLDIQEVLRIKPAKGLAGVKGVTVDDIENLKKTAIKGLKAQDNFEKLFKEHEKLKKQLPSMADKIKKAADGSRLAELEKMFSRLPEQIKKQLSLEGLSFKEKKRER